MNQVNLNLKHSIEIPGVRLFNQANSNSHWRIPNNHKKRLQKLIKLQWLAQKIKNVQTPCLVKITRYAPKKYDSDNYIYNCKGIRDTVSSLIKPGLAPGQADSNEKDIQWEYSQETCRKYSLLIEIYN